MSVFHWFRKSFSIAALEERLAALEKAEKGRELEWDEWFHKFRLLYARLARKAKEVESQEEAARIVQPNGDVPAVPGSQLTPRARLIRDQVNAARIARGEGVK